MISQLNTKLMYLLFPGHSRDLQQLGSILQSLNLHFDKIQSIDQAAKRFMQTSACSFWINPKLKNFRKQEITTSAKS